MTVFTRIFNVTVALGAVLSLAGTDINAALEEMLENRPDIRAVVMIGDGDWNTGEPPVAAAQKMRLKDIPLFGVPLGSEIRLPDLDLQDVSAPTYGIVGENVQIPFTIESSLDRDVRTIVRLRDDTGVERTKDITIPARSTGAPAKPSRSIRRRATKRPSSGANQCK